MEQNTQQNSEVIDLRDVFKKIFSRKKLFLKVWVVTFILSCIWVLPQPRAYMSEVSMVPENTSEMSGGMLGTLASSFGVNIGNMETSDAFYPELYPDVVSTNEFLVGLFDVQVVAHDEDNLVRSDYFTHITRDRKENPLTFPFRWMGKKMKSMFGDKKKPLGKDINPNCMSKEEDMLVGRVRDDISCSVDKKTNVITITVWDQDAYVAATMADSVRVRLQDFITQYRTSKSRIDMEYYAELTEEARKEYDAAVAAYSRYCDTHMNVMMQVYISERDKLENDMSNKLTTYNAMKTQYEAAKAKVQERTPAFTTMSKASVPFRPTRPKRVIFVAAMLFLSTFVTIGWIFKNEVVEQMTHIK